MFNSPSSAHCCCSCNRHRSYDSVSYHIAVIPANSPLRTHQLCFLSECSPILLYTIFFCLVNLVNIILFPISRICSTYAVFLYIGCSCAVYFISSTITFHSYRHVWDHISWWWSTFHYEVPRLLICLLHENAADLFVLCPSFNNSSPLPLHSFNCVFYSDGTFASS